MEKHLFISLTIICLCLSASSFGRTYHVSVTGSDVADGSAINPLRTINAAAQKALPGDTVTVHAGTYREWVNPLYGGIDENTRIVYQAAEGEKVEIKGSEIVTGWKKDKSGIWIVTLPNSFFGGHNPFNELIWGDWFDNYERDHHTAEVYLNDVSLYEVASKDEVYSKQPVESYRDPEGSRLKWFAEVGADNTVIYADFGDADPRKELVEVAVRPTCFYPTREGLNYITIKGFHISQAATQWGAPTAEQIGMVATHWCKGWIIEDNVISNSRCNGISLGKEASSGHNLWTLDPSIDGCPWYIETIFAALKAGWSKDRVGSHIIRNNEISYCEQTGICGSLGPAFSQVYGNNIHHIWVKRQFNGAEIAAIKFHAAIDVQIHDNVLHDSKWGLWFDWMAQGSRVSRNLMYGNQLDMFYEVDHGPFVFENNILLSEESLWDCSESGAYLHNFFGGAVTVSPQDRHIPYHEPHSTEIRGVFKIEVGNNRFHNNIFADQGNEDRVYGLSDYKAKEVANIAEEGNVFCGKVLVKVEEKDDRFSLSFPAANIPRCKSVCSEKLGRAAMSRLPYENADGSPFVINADFLGNRRSDSPAAGPLESYEGSIVK